MDKDSELWDGALAQMKVTLDFPGGPTTFEGMLQETDNEEFLWRDIADQRQGVGYIAWAYIGGDNLHGAIFEHDGDVAVARLSDQEIAECSVNRDDPAPDCAKDEGDEPAAAASLPATGQLVEVDAVDRLAESTLYDSVDVDWYQVSFEPQDRCVDCFNPYAFVSRSADYVAEVCVFVSDYEVESRGGETECFGGDPATEPGLVGCCTTDAGSMVNLDTPWEHEAGDESTMYIRVRAAKDVSTCEPYQLTYGHFTG